MVEEVKQTSEAAPERKKCSIDLKPMAEWVGGSDPKVCRPCLLGPVLQWYADELRQNGKGAMADSLIEKANIDEPLTLCKELDTIKERVESSLRERLEDFDCAVQTYNDDDDETTLRGEVTDG
jgi:hypothetical protein